MFINARTGDGYGIQQRAIFGDVASALDGLRGILGPLEGFLRNVGMNPKVVGAIIQVEWGGLHQWGGRRTTIQVG